MMYYRLIVMKTAWKRFYLPKLRFVLVTMACQMSGRAMYLSTRPRSRCHQAAAGHICSSQSKGKGKKVKVGFFYSATYSGDAATSRAVQSYEVAVDWQEPMVRERKCYNYNTRHRPNQPHQAFTP